MDECHRIKGVMVSEDFRKGFTTIVRVRCKMWGCPYCGPQNALQWRAYLLDRFNKAFGHEQWCFYTVTAHKKAHITPRMSLLNLQGVWKRLYDRLRRHFEGAKLEYVRVFEQHKSGRFHMHFLLNVGQFYDAHNFVAENLKREFRHPECIWFRRACVACGGGWRVHVRRVWDSEKKTENVGLVVGYILKYISKQMTDMDMPKHQRRIQTSRAVGSPKTNARGSGTWEHRREVSEEWFLKQKNRVLDMSTGEVLTIASFEGEHYYPPYEFYKGE